MDQGERKGAEIREEESGPIYLISGCKNHDWDHVFLFFLELHDLRYARIEQQHVLLACLQSEGKLWVCIFFFLTPAQSEGKERCVCVCVCFFTPLQSEGKESFGCVCLFFFSSSLAK